MNQRSAGWSRRVLIGCVMAGVLSAPFNLPVLSAPPKPGAEHTPVPQSSGSSAEQSLASVLHGLSQDLSHAVSQRELLRLLMQLQQSLDEARAGGVRPTVISTGEQGARLLQILSDLWGICTRLTSSDLTLPCDRLEPFVQSFNAVTGEATVRLDRHRPPGICLFCKNVCTQAAADQLMSAMKAAAIKRLMLSIEQLENTPAQSS
jgi:hypothetical protein